MNRERFRTLLFWLLPVAGVAFGIWYIRQATVDVVYSDYVRLVDSYLPDVYNLKKFLVPDVLTRVPINYLGRIVNLELFGYSVFFDRVLGVIGLGLAGWVFGLYCREHRIGSLWFIFLMVVMFSLNKWEMLTNGSGWCHFLAFVGFYYHEVVLDRVWGGMERPGDRIRLMVLPWLIILGAAGPYGVSYAAVLLMAYGFCLIMEKTGRKKYARDGHPYIVYMLCTLLPLLLYIVSNTYVIEDHAGATGRPLLTILMDNPTFPIRFLLKSLAGILVGGEELASWMERGLLSNKGCYFLGMLVGLGYLLALWMNWRYRLYEKTIMPLMLLAGGGINHILVFLTRYIFEREEYALSSSRYTLQFQVGVFGIILTVALAAQLKEARRSLWQALGLLFCVAFLWGNVYTTNQELIKAKYRKERFTLMAEDARRVPYLSDEEFEAEADDLANMLEYWNSRERLRNAYRILEENKLNIFREDGK